LLKQLICETSMKHCKNIQPKICIARSGIT
jgi:hypothetical protein